ncbi:MAG: hypothetical protein JWN93_135 [Hyphomicrobiales bacterium]|jgi:tripartite-type tricarboxylate transporter receptor subunit TctC|nr:hypothetical protein [Hyphomicrobiales bacterium]
MIREIAKGLALGAAMLCGPAALAQSPWPEGRTIKIVVPFAAGGATDVIARIMGEKLSRMWTTPAAAASVVIENKGGAGGNIGTEQVARAEPNGDTILIVSVGLATNPYLYKKLSYDPAADFAPVSLVALVPNMLITGNDKPYKTVAELVAWGKANPGKLTYASSGVGTSIHLSGELFKKLSGVDMTHVPYRGSAPAVQDVMAGRVDVMFDNITSSLQQVRGGTLRGVAITTAKRSSFAPELPPVNDVVPGFDVSSWFAFFVPAKTPRAIVDRLARDTKTALEDAGVKEKFAALAAEAVGSTPEELGAFVKVENDRWGKLIRDAGISAE